MPTNPIINYPGELYYFTIKLLLTLGDYGNFIWRFFGLIFVAVLIYLSFKKLFPAANLPNKPKQYLYTPLIFSTVIAIGVIVLRFPNLVLFELNPDESQWIVGAATLLKDPRFWISVNGETSGPFNLYPLTIIYFLGQTITYSSLRLFGLIFCTVPSILLLYASFINFFSDRIARIIILPLIVCLAFLYHWDLIAFSSEQIPILLISLSIFFYSKILKSVNKKTLYLSFLGLTLGSIPFAKLQAAPIALATSLFCVGEIIIIHNGRGRKQRLKEIIVFSLAALLPSFVVLTYVLFFNIFYDFWQAYVVHNLAFAASGRYGIKASWLMKLFLLRGLIFDMTDTNLYFSFLLVSAFAANYALSKSKKPLSGNYTRLILLSLLMSITAVYCVVQPGNDCPHYVNLLLIPILFFTGTSLGAAYTSYAQNGIKNEYKFKRYIIIFVILTVIMPSFAGILRGSRGIKYKNYYYRSEVAKTIMEYSRPNEKMAVWGWMDRYYVLTGLLQGTRSPHSHLQILKNKQQDYFLKLYVSDLAKNRPAIFLDAVTRYSFCFNNPESRFENFPLLKQFIEENYKFVADIGGFRIFVRNDRYYLKNMEDS